MVSYAAAKKLEEEAPAPTEPISSDDPTPPMEPSSGEEFTRSFETEELELPAEPSAEPEGERTRDTMDSIDDSLEVIHL